MAGFRQLNDAARPQDEENWPKRRSCQTGYCCGDKNLLGLLREQSVSTVIPVWRKAARPGSVHPVQEIAGAGDTVGLDGPYGIDVPE
ncbi:MULTISPECIES: hypothetical protein [unclassified Pannonibacter]|uniref:hypothetical protein n=1 Tax=unclassified Pannonibacter TaxID=2627228 RepID=UPI001645C9CA|nr:MULTISPECIES: hypothetical protein [unclassified Pannonibacter]